MNQAFLLFEKTRLISINNLIFIYYDKRFRKKNIITQLTIHF